MKELIKKVEIGEYNFDIKINRDIALTVAEKEPEFFEKLFSNSNRDTKINFKNVGKLRELFEMNDFISINSARIVNVALPLMLVNEKLNAKEIIKYVSDNDADEIFNNAMVEFILMGFTNNELDKKPKVKFVIR